MAADVIYGLSGILGPPTPVPGETLELIAEANRRYEENRAKLAIAGRAHWNRAHEKQSWTRAEFEAWVADIPQFGCSCRKDAEEYIAAHPPPLESEAGMRFWWWEFHDAINAKLEKFRPSLTEVAIARDWPTAES